MRLMGWRRHLGPPDSGAWVVALFVLLGAFIIAYFTSVAFIESRFPSVRPGSSTSSAGTLVCIRLDDGTLDIGDFVTKRGEWLLDLRGIDPSKRVVFYDRTIVTREAPPWGFGSAQRATATMRFMTMPYPQEAIGGPLTQIEEVEVLRFLQKHRPNDLPELLRTASSTSVAVTLRVGVLHNLFLFLTTALLTLGLTWGVWRVVRCEILYRRCWLKDCAGCGASLSGMAVQRCPSCGAATGRRLWFVVESFRLARRIVRWGAELFSGSRDWKRWWRYSGWAIAARILMYVAVSITIMVVGMTVITHFWQPLPYSSRASGTSTHAYRLPDGTLYADPIGYPMTEREREIQETSERLSFMVYVYEDVTASRARYWLECRPMGTDKFTIEETDYAPIVAAFDRANPGRVPKPLVQSGGAPVTIPHPPGVKHNIAAATLAILTFGGLAGAIIRLGLTHKGSPAHPECPKCFYSLEGNTTGVCPECGHRLGGGAAG